jgi:hypothetical protein
MTLRRRILRAPGVRTHGTKTEATNRVRARYTPKLALQVVRLLARAPA